jgi:hypothetical protein
MIISISILDKRKRNSNRLHFHLKKVELFATLIMWICTGIFVEVDDFD